jgi:hypothetical protein
MRKPLVVLVASCLLLCLSGPLTAAEDNALSEEKKRVEAATRDYIDGWYEGDAERMANALHPDLAKRNVERLPDGRNFLRTLSADAMVEFTRAGFGARSRKEGQRNEVIILDLLENSASVKSISHEFTDYLHLAKVNGQWKIVNVLWEPAKAVEEGE